MWFAVIAGCWCSVGTPWSPAHKTTDGSGCSHARAAAARMAHEAPDGWELSSNAADTDVLHYKLELEIDPDGEWIGGTNVMTVRSLVDDLTLFHFRLDDALAISAVEVNGTPVTWNRAELPTIAATLDRPYAAGEEFSLLVAYDGHPSTEGHFAHGIGFSGGRAFTFSCPWFAYTWWPTKEVNDDKAAAELWFTVPDDLVVTSNGRLIGVDDLGNGRKRHRWETCYPIAPYLISLAAARYSVQTGTYSYDGRSMPLVLYWAPASLLQDLQDMLDVFGERYGLYPFIEEKYGIYRIYGYAGGMEHQTITAQSAFGEFLTAHELAHQWWGDMITCATWHDVWLNEGFATYSEAIWAEGKPDGGWEAYQQHMASNRPRRVDDSVYCYNTSNVGRIFSGDFSYNKGAWVLHMLRHVVGDAAFFDILAAYRAAYEYASATTDNFQTVAERVYGKDLDWFFDTWIYSIGAPAYEYAWRQEAGGECNYVELYVRQVQRPEYPIFPMPIDIITTRDGHKTTYVVWNNERAEHLLLPTTGPIDGLAFDPDHWILSDPQDARQVTFLEGPPKVVDVTPAPDSAVKPGDPPWITVQFHKDVRADAAHFALVGGANGPITFTFAYDAITRTAILTPDNPLPADDYALTVADEIIDVKAGLALDGEVFDAHDAAALPSGDGLPGGLAILEFIVLPGGDLDGDDVVDQSDLGILLASFDLDDGGDLDGDGDTDHADLGILLANWGYGT